MNISKINGFLVVTDDVLFNPLRNGIIYKGFGRHIPKGFSSDHYDKLLDDDLEAVYEQWDENYSREIGIDHLIEYSKAYELYNYCCEKYPSEPCDFITFYSEHWKQSKVIDTIGLNLEFMGYDITFYSHFYSLILNGVFFLEQYFEEFVKDINRYGLFSDKRICEKYIDCYRELAKEDICESFGMEKDNVIIEIQKVIISPQL